MSALRRQRHPYMMASCLVAGLIWLAGALWAAWDSAGLARLIVMPVGRVLDLPLFGFHILTMALGLPSQLLILQVTSRGQRKNKAPAAGAIRPRWTHDLPLLLLTLAYAILGWIFLGGLSVTLAAGTLAQVQAVCFAILMGLALLICAGIIARYGLEHDVASESFYQTL